MRLIIILICLGLERYTDVGRYLKRFNWFEAYLGLLKKIIRPDALWKGHLGMVWVTLPILVLIGLVYMILCNLAGAWLGGLISLAFLFYCFGPMPLHPAINTYLKAQDQEDTSAAEQASAVLLLNGGASENESGPRAITQAIFAKANSSLLAVIFWFVVVGLFGALLYRLTALMQRVAQRADSEFHDLEHAANQWLGVLDWVPVRITALAYALAGNFTQCFTRWLTGAVSGFNQNRAFLLRCGLISLGANEEDAASANLDENRAALALIDRALIIALVLIAVFTLGAWIY